MSKYLKLFNQDAEYHLFKETEEYILPNVSYIKANNIVYYNPYAEAKSGIIMARYNATEENKLALADTSNVKSLKANGENVEFNDMYYFNEVGEYDIEIELIDTTLINGVIYDENESAISNSMFCKSDDWVGACLTSVILPEGITIIGNAAFGGCTNLTSINIPDSVTSIGDSAFYECSGLTSIVIPDSVTSIGEYAFYDCTSLPVEDNLRYADTYLIGAVDTTLSTCTIKDGTKWIGDEAFYYCSSLTSITIPDSVTSIGDNAFRDCTSLTGITIPDSVTSIGQYAFDDCTGLENVVVSSANTVYDSRENCNCIIETSTNTLIKGCNNSFIPNSVTSIGDNAFYECSGLTSIVIPDSVTTIGDIAFMSCSNLTSITIPDSVVSIGEGAFGNCSGLTSIVIPDSVTSIGNNAFGCSGLTSVYIGSGVTSIGEGAFWMSSNLKKITCNAPTAPTIYSDTFEGVAENGVLKVPAGSNYSSWMSTNEYYLGKYNWTVEYI